MKFDRDTIQDPTYKVTLNGKELDYCVAADEEAGTARVLEVDYYTLAREGKTEFIPDASSPHGYRCIELKGKVQITRIKEDPPKKEHPTEELYGYHPWDPCGYPTPFQEACKEHEGHTLEDALNEPRPLPVAKHVTPLYPAKPSRWVCGVKLGPCNKPPLEFVIDESLPPLGELSDRHYMRIAKGRIVKPDKPTKNGTVYTADALRNAYETGDEA